MSLVRISEKLAVAEQPSPGAFRQFKADGFTAVINNHPNGEEPHQPGSAAEKCAAEDAGLGYRFIPVTSPQITEADVRAFQKAVADAPGPVLAHCGSGTRSLTLYAIGEVLDRRMNPEDIRPFGERFGFDLTVAEQWIARRGKQRPTVKASSIPGRPASSMSSPIPPRRNARSSTRYSISMRGRVGRRRGALIPFWLMSPSSNLPSSGFST